MAFIPLLPKHLLCHNANTLCLLNNDTLYFLSVYHYTSCCVKLIPVITFRFFFITSLAKKFSFLFHFELLFTQKKVPIKLDKQNTSGARA